MRRARLLRRLSRLAAGLLLGGLATAGPACGPSPGPGGARTVVLVTVDTLRRDHLGAYDPASPARTPRADAFARTAVLFADARTPSVLTLPAHVTMLSGLPPAAHGVRSNAASRVPPAAARAWRLAPEALREAGRCCGAFVSAGPLAARYGLASAFDAYDDEGLEDRTGLGYRERPGAVTVGKALAWLAARGPSRPVFLWVHLFEPHDPCPRGYARDVEDADAAIGLLLDGLDAQGRGDAAVLLAADHGEALGDLGERTHGLLLAESVLRVPLVVRAPGRGAGRREDPADLADVAPTILALAGAPAAALAAVPGAGRDLLGPPAPADRPRVAEALHAWHQHRWAQLTCAVVGGWKLEDRGLGRERLLRLDPARPLGQDRGAAAEGRPEAEAPARALRAYRRFEDRQPTDAGAAPGGYGRGGAVGFFLEPADNGRRLDPYEVVEDAYRINRAASMVLADPPLEARLKAALDELDTLRRRDPGNPSVAFWRGRALRTLARHGEALGAFREALDLGGCDPEAALLLLRSGIAAGAAADALVAFTPCAGRMALDERLVEAWAQALEAGGDGAAASQVRAAARASPADPGARARDGCR